MSTSKVLTDGDQAWVDASVIAGAGTKGDKGDTGAQGAQGETGAQGAQGLQGAAGANGTNGTNGAQGAKGDSGSWMPAPFTEIPIELPPDMVFQLQLTGNY